MKKDHTINKIKTICNIYNCNLLIMNKYDTSYYDEKIKTIGLSIKNKYYRPRSVKNLATLFCHELAHHIQYTEFKWWPNEKNLFEVLDLEWEAERMAYFLCQQYFPEVNVHHNEFNWCRKREDIEFLRDWYKI